MKNTGVTGQTRKPMRFVVQNREKKFTAESLQVHCRANSSSLPSKLCITAEQTMHYCRADSGTHFFTCVCPAGVIFLFLHLLFFIFVSCNTLPAEFEKKESLADIFPEYTGVTIPPNISPLNFIVQGSEAVRVLFAGETYSFIVSGKKQVKIPAGKWKKLLSETSGKSISVTVFQKKNKKWRRYLPFNWFVSVEKIDDYLAYRLIEPTYANWNEIGIFQRELSSYREKEIICNSKTDHNCMNCHTFNQQNPEQMVLHFRKKNPGTLLINEGKMRKLSTKTDQTISHFVYPSWHPGGNHIAFSTNETHMSFFDSKDKIIEVYDTRSDIVIYDINRNEIYADSLIASPEHLENFPVFSSDGNYLYYCTCPKVDSLPQNYRQIQYKLCRIGFDSEKQRFSETVDTLINLSQENKGISLPSVSPDGQFIICSVANSGAFMSWEKASDLYLYHIERKKLIPLTGLNSCSSESNTSWSSNSRWLVFSSRRTDDLHNRLFLAYIDKEGKTGKPFLLPQKNPGNYHASYKAYNLPQFIINEVSVNPLEIAKSVKGDEILQVQYKKGCYSYIKEKSFRDESEIN